MLKARVVLAAIVVGISGCASAKSEPPASAPEPTPTKRVRDTVEVQVRDPELERRVARVELRLIEKEAQVEELQTRLEDARDEVVRTMAKLQTLASRAEAASAMAEADVALQSLRTSAAGQQLPEIGQASNLVKQSNTEFGKQNFGGALYLANQARAIAATGRTRAAAGNRGASKQGEIQFALPIRLKAASRGNVREGPGTSYGVVFAIEPGSALTGYSYADEWIRVSDDAGRSGWIYRALVTRP